MTDNPETPEEPIPEFNPEKPDDEYAVLELISAVKQDGSRAWAYVALKPSLYMEYTKKIMNGERISVLDYGEIIETGEGDSPSDETRRRMEEQFGADHQFSEKLKAEMEEHLKNIEENG